MGAFLRGVVDWAGHKNRDTKAAEYFHIDNIYIFFLDVVSACLVAPVGKAVVMSNRKKHCLDKKKTKGVVPEQGLANRSIWVSILVLLLVLCHPSSPFVVHPHGTS